MFGSVRLWFGSGSDRTRTRTMNFEIFKPEPKLKHEIFEPEPNPNMIGVRFRVQFEVHKHVWVRIEFLGLVRAWINTRNVSVWFYWHLNQKQNLKSDWEMFLKVDWIVHRNTDHETFVRLTLMMLDEITYWMMCHNDKTSWIRIPVNLG